MIAQLQATQKAAHAAWLACPASKKADKARLAAVLDAAAKAVAAAKRAGQPAKPTQAEELAAWQARQAASRAESRHFDGYGNDLRWGVE